MATISSLEAQADTLTYKEFDKEGFFEDFKNQNGLKRLTIFTGGANLGKTTNLKNTVEELFNRGLVTSYASLIAPDNQMIRFRNTAGRMEYRSEYALPMNRPRHGFRVIEKDAVVIDAHTTADVIILSEIRTVEDVILLDAALATSKPVFAEIHGHSAIDAITRLLAHDEMLTQEFAKDTVNPRLLETLGSCARHDPSFSVETVNEKYTRLPFDLDGLKSIVTAGRILKDDDYERVTKWEKIVQFLALVNFR